MSVLRPRLHKWSLAGHKGVRPEVEGLESTMFSHKLHDDDQFLQHESLIYAAAQSIARDSFLYENDKTLTDRI